MSVGNLNIQLSLDSAKFKQGISDADRQTKQFANNAKSNLSQIENSLGGMGTKLSIIAGDVLGGYAVQSVKSVATLTDNYTDLGNRLRLVTEGETQHTQAMQSVFDISLKTNQQLTSTSTIYQRIVQNAETLKISQSQVAGLTETVAKAVAISGASTASADAALMQFGQSLASGVFRGQEFNSVMEQTPALAYAIADGLGVSVGELRRLAGEGELTTDVIIRALEKAKGSVDEKFNTRVVTLGMAWTNFNTQMTRFVGEADKSIGASQLLVSVLDGLSSNLSSIVTIAGSVGVAFAGVKLSQRAQETLALSAANRQNAQSALVSAQNIKLQATADLEHARASMQSLSAQLQLARTEQERTVIRERMKAQSAQIIALTKAETAAMAGLATAQKGASLFSNALSFMGGPIGLAITGLTLGASALYEWYSNAEQAQQKNLDFVKSLDGINQEMTKMSSLELKVTIADTQDSIGAQKTKIKELEGELKKLQDQAEVKVRFAVDENGNIAEITKSLRQQQIEADAVTRKMLELKQAKDDLEKTEASLSAQMDAVPLADLRARIEALNPHIDTSTINFNDLGWSVDQLNNIFPNASANGSSFMGIVSQLGIAAMVSAGKFDVLAESAAKAMNVKLSNHLADNDLQIQINKAKQNGNTKLANELTAKRNTNNKLESLGVKAGSDDYKKLFESELQLVASSGTGGRTNSKGGKSFAQEMEQLRHSQRVAGLKGADKFRAEAEYQAKEKGYKGKDAETYIDQFVKTKLAENHGSGGSKTDYQKQFTDQITEMQNRLSSLKANASDISLYGQTSQYQEVKKLTEDIAENAEKYSAYGTDGVKKLQEMAAQIDEAQQKIAIAQFSFDNTEKLQAMEFELSLLGKSRQEQELLQYNHSLDLEASKLKIGMSKENIAQLDIEIAKLKERHAILQQKTEANRSDPVAGFKGGLQAIEDDVTNVNENIKSITVSAFGTMSDSLNDFIMTGKANFGDMAKSILSDISKMIVKMLMFQAIKAGMSALGFNGFSEGGLVGGSFAVGGYTGDGGKYTPAGIVHRGEYVLTKEATSRLGVDYLNYLNYGTRRGFANGGGVAVPRVPKLNYGNNLTGATHNQVSITVNVESDSATNSEVSSTADEAKALGKLIESKVLEVIVKQKRNGNLLA
ncbi:tail protein [Actinobacillus pleuropneumoniae]|uniref:Putative tail protein n=1 Tax=Actinobacillus pleuropneumoniae TaxID=715 RepID=A0A448TXQ9_ACTPL|nr:tape measure protein [Actinobacillus pleuropneumoniae]QSZ38522.1 tail protein [Actinobacillus pleuropneumoniae]VEJ16419.1 putative tail protein [Actinobacillus pleuropneumoniae]